MICFGDRNPIVDVVQMLTMSAWAFYLQLTFGQSYQGWPFFCWHGRKEGWWIGQFGRKTKKNIQEHMWFIFKPLGFYMTMAWHIISLLKLFRRCSRCHRFARRHWRFRNPISWCQKWQNDFKTKVTKYDYYKAYKKAADELINAVNERYNLNKKINLADIKDKNGNSLKGLWFSIDFDKAGSPLFTFFYSLFFGGYTGYHY